MHPHEQIEGVCTAICQLLVKLARARAGGEVSESQFVQKVLEIEAELVTPGGFNLTASNTLDDWTVFKLRPNGDEEPCAEFEYLPETGEFRRVGSSCGESH